MERCGNFLSSSVRYTRDRRYESSAVCHWTQTLWCNRTLTQGPTSNPLGSGRTDGFSVCTELADLAMEGLPPLLPLLPPDVLLGFPVFGL